MTVTAERSTRKRGQKPPVVDNNAMIGHSKVTPYLFSTPAIIAVTAILAFPVLYGVWQSLYRPEIFGAPAEWVGLQNYIDMFQDSDFWSALYRTAIFVGGCWWWERLSGCSSLSPCTEWSEGSDF